MINTNSREIRNNDEIRDARFEEPNKDLMKQKPSNQQDMNKKKLSFKTTNENSMPKPAPMSDITGDRFREIVMKKMQKSRTNVAKRNKEKSVIATLVLITAMITIVNVPSALVYVLRNEYQGRNGYEVF